MSVTEEKKTCDPSHLFFACICLGLSAEQAKNAVLELTRRCKHENVGATWRKGYKEVVCIDCNTRLHCGSPIDLESDPARGC